MSQYERPNIAQMQGYASGEQPEDGRSIKLNTNENPYPPSPRVAAALASFATEQLRIYPQPDARLLRQAIAEHHNVSVDNVVITHAGDEALRLAITTFVPPDGTVASTEPTYSLYPVLAQIQGASMSTHALSADWSLPSDFAAKVNAAGAQLTCVVNPHAPSGHFTAIERLRELASDLTGVLLVDEAYADFVDIQGTADATDLVRERDDVLILRTFSKGYSLAGLRLGYLLGHPSLIQPILEKRGTAITSTPSVKRSAWHPFKTKTTPNKPGQRYAKTAKHSPPDCTPWASAWRPAKPIFCSPGCPLMRTQNRCTRNSKPRAFWCAISPRHASAILCALPLGPQNRTRSF